MLRCGSLRAGSLSSTDCWASGRDKAQQVPHNHYMTLNRNHEVGGCLELRSLSKQLVDS